MRKLICLLVLAMAVALGAGCAKPVHKDWMAIGGSRSDATVKMGYVWNPQNEKPETSQQQAIDLAAQKCRTWGYDGAEPFGSTLTKCTNMSFQPFAGVVCYQMQAEAEFQCIGSIPPEIENVSTKAKDKSK